MMIVVGVALLDGLEVHNERAFVPRLGLVLLASEHIKIAQRLKNLSAWHACDNLLIEADRLVKFCLCRAQLRQVLQDEKVFGAELAGGLVLRASFFKFADAEVKFAESH